MEPVALVIIIVAICVIMGGHDNSNQEIRRAFVKGDATADEYTESSFGQIVLMVFLVIVGLFVFAGITGSQ